MSEDRSPYRRLGQPEESSELDHLMRAVRVHRDWIWHDGLRIVKLADRVRDLEQETVETKATLERITTPGVN
jgi:hypothetical protein